MKAATIRPTYAVRDWSVHFEVSQSKRAARLHWVAMPNKHDGKGYRRIMQREDGTAIYGAWSLIVQVASRCPTRGVLEDEDGPLDAEDLALKTGGRAEIFKVAIGVLLEVGWLEQTRHSERAPSGLRVDSEHARQSLPTGRNRTGRHGTERKSKTGCKRPVLEVGEGTNGNGNGDGSKEANGHTNGNGAGKDVTGLLDWTERALLESLGVVPMVRRLMDWLKSIASYPELGTCERFLALVYGRVRGRKEGKVDDIVAATIEGWGKNWSPSDRDLRSAHNAIERARKAAEAEATPEAQAKKAKLDSILAERRAST